MPPPSLSPERAKLAEFYSARSATITPLPWQSFAPPFPAANEAVRIPRKFELQGDKAIIRKEDGRLVIEPSRLQSLVALLKQLQPIGEDFAPIEDPAPEPVEL